MRPYYHVRVPQHIATTLMAYLMKRCVEFQCRPTKPFVMAEVIVSVGADRVDREQLAYAYQLHTGREANFDNGEV